MACYSVAALRAKLAIKLPAEVTEKILSELLKGQLHSISRWRQEVYGYVAGVSISIVDGELTVSGGDTATVQAWRDKIAGAMQRTGQALVFQALRKQGLNIQDIQVAKNGMMVGTVKVRN